MYEKFYGVREKPFNVTPDPKFLYLSQQHKQALAHLIYGVKEKKGITLLTGEVGTGKTTIINAMLERVNQAVRIAHISNPNMVLEDLFTYIFDGFKIDAPTTSKSKCLIILRDFLLKQTKSGINSILIIDEAQNLSLEILEEIRLLSNVETTKEKLIQILLVGQPELNLKLANPQLRQLRQRISARFHITPLNIKETQEYVAQRLLVAGASNTEIFNKTANNEIFFYTHGIPRLINIICDLSLVIGFAFQKARIDERIVKEAIKSLADNHSQGLSDKPLPPEQTQHLAEIDTARTVSKKSILCSLGIVLLSCLVFGITFFWAWDLSVMVKTINRTINQIAPIPKDTGLKDEPLADKNPMTDKRDKTEIVAEKTEEVILPKEQVSTTPQIETRSYVPESEEEGGIEGLQTNTAEELTAQNMEEQEIVPKSLEEDIEDINEDVMEPKEAPRYNKPAEKLRDRAKKIVAKKGDTLTGISIAVYGLASKEIFSFVRAANPEITDINHIRVGQNVLFPELPSDLSLPYSSFGVQVDAFWNLEEANNRLLQLMDKGYRPLLIPVHIPQRGRLYKVIMGIFPYKDEANRYGDSLKIQEEFSSIEVIPLPHYEPIGSER